MLRRCIGGVYFGKIMLNMMGTNKSSEVDLTFYSLSKIKMHQNKSLQHLFLDTLTTQALISFFLFKNAEIKNGNKPYE